ncbi:hypothetical protein [Acinetobacter baumannii]|uniref:hypothetical protein n=1 Tax=Acinetobacter baumannii TaxID=470 RepID=UPI000BF93EE1|nr:hypothetical protein [Acinetobacter baumannii]MDV4253057.1 hypothetical protein [Acinetobacter baumannii]
MTLKKILMLDDNNVDLITTNIKSKCKRLGIDVEIFILNPKDSKFICQTTGDIDPSKVKEEITQLHKNIKYDIVACDFNFASQSLNGYELIKWLINESKGKKFSFKKAKFICYSSEEDKFTQQIIANDEIIKLIRLNIYAFYKREKLVSEISTLINNIHNNFSPSEHLQQKLNESPDLVFKYVYPPYKGKTLNQISDEIEKDTHHSREFQKHIIDLTYAHIIELNT